MPDSPVVVNVNVDGPAGPVRVARKTGRLTQLLWFLFIGWWLGALAVVAAYLCFALVITIPVGVSIVNNIPKLIAQRQPPITVSYWGQVQTPQHNIILRAIWFIVLGLLLTAAWMSIAYALCLTIIGMPIGFWMFDRAPALLTLHRN